MALFGMSAKATENRHEDLLFICVSALSGER